MAYLIYRHRQNILIKEGRLRPSDTTCHPKEEYNGIFIGQGTHNYHVQVPDEFMKVSRKGKILCQTKEEIPIAVEMLKEHYRNKIESVKQTSEAAIKNITDIINSTDYTIIN